MEKLEFKFAVIESNEDFAIYTGCNDCAKRKLKVLVYFSINTDEVGEFKKNNLKYYKIKCECKIK